jgi:hypothetical protein
MRVLPRSGMPPGRRAEWARVDQVVCELPRTIRRPSEGVGVTVEPRRLADGLILVWPTLAPLPRAISL